MNCGFWLPEGLLLGKATGAALHAPVACGSLAFSLASLVFWSWVSAAEAHTALQATALFLHTPFGHRFPTFALPPARDLKRKRTGRTALACTRRTAKSKDVCFNIAFQTTYFAFVLSGVSF